jgi:hypothetical protein
MGKDYFQVEESFIDYCEIANIDISGIIRTHEGSIIRLPFEKLSGTDRRQVYNIIQERTKGSCNPVSLLSHKRAIKKA